MFGLTWSKTVDIPPVWLLLFIAMARLWAVDLPFRPVEHPVADLLGGLLVGGGLLLVVAAAVQMHQHRTTVIPHKEPEKLVTNGLFARSRNPIYLGDTMVLTGLILYWGAWPSLLLVPLFVWIATDRFIRPEEQRLERAFGPAYKDWARRTRRWL